MSPPAPMSVRRRFLVALGRGLYVTWPVLSAILVIEVALGLLIGLVEGWSVGEAVYFSFVTGLTIGYGDIVPRQTLTRVLAIVIGFGGILLTGLVAATAVNAMRATRKDSGKRCLRSWRRIAGESAKPRCLLVRGPNQPHSCRDRTAICGGREPIAAARPRSVRAPTGASPGNPGGGYRRGVAERGVEWGGSSQASVSAASAVSARSR